MSRFTLRLEKLPQENSLERSVSSPSDMVNALSWIMTLFADLICKYMSLSISILHFLISDLAEEI